MAFIASREDRRFSVSACGDIEAVRADWATLEGCGAGTAFQSRGWLEPWYAILAPLFDAQPLFVTVREKSSGRPVMFLPLCRRCENGITIVEFADLGVSDYDAPLVDPDFAVELASRPNLLRAVQAAMRPADIFRLEKAPERLGETPNPLTFAAKRRLSYSAWETRLPPTKAEFDAALPDRSFVKELERKKRRIAGRGAVRFEEATSLPAARLAFEALCRQRADRFHELDRDNILARAAFRSFYETVALAQTDRIARLFTLSVGEEIVSTIFGLQQRGRFHMIMSTIGDARWKSSSPGNVAMDRLVSQLIEERYEVLDFTIGDEAYKRSFGATERHLRTGVGSLSWRGSPLSAVDRAKTALGGRKAFAQGRVAAFLRSY